MVLRNQPDGDWGDVPLVLPGSVLPPVVLLLLVLITLNVPLLSESESFICFSPVVLPTLPTVRVGAMLSIYTGLRSADNIVLTVADKTSMPPVAVEFGGWV